MNYAQEISTGTSSATGSVSAPATGGGLMNWIGTALSGLGPVLAGIFGGGGGAEEGVTTTQEQIDELQEENKTLANKIDELSQSRIIWAIGAAGVAYIVAEKM